jgi:hypothetical protein
LLLVVKEESFKQEGGNEEFTFVVLEAKSTLKNLSIGTVYYFPTVITGLLMFQIHIHISLSFHGNGITCKLYDEVLHICIEKEIMNTHQVITSPNSEIVAIPEVDELMQHIRAEYDGTGVLISESYDSETNSRRHLPSLSIPTQTVTDTVVCTPGISNQREVFVFGFGAVVFWGFPRGEVCYRNFIVSPDNA